MDPTVIGTGLRNFKSPVGTKPFDVCLKPVAPPKQLVKTACTTQQISLSQIEELEKKITSLNARIAKILNRSDQTQKQVFESRVVALRDSSVV